MAEVCSWITCDDACSGRSACEDVASLGLGSPGIAACGNWDPTSSSLLGLAVGLSVRGALEAVIWRRSEAGEFNSSLLAAVARMELTSVLIFGFLLFCGSRSSTSSCLDFAMCSLWWRLDDESDDELEPSVVS